jgi:hypothetical protein
LPPEVDSRDSVDHRESHIPLRASFRRGSFCPAWKPFSKQSADTLDQLLTNVYRAYDMRDEEAIYDRLALTITGEQLTELYLNTRRSLELENHGGARAKVDEVEILDVHSIESADNAGFAVDLSWTVSGSVTRFGDTQYRTSALSGRSKTSEELPTRGRNKCSPVSQGSALNLTTAALLVGACQDASALGGPAQRAF